MLLYGGYTGNDELLDDLWKLEQSVWRRVTLPAQGPCPGPRAMHSSLVYDGCMVVLGGTGLVSGCKEEAKGLYKLITTGLNAFLGGTIGRPHKPDRPPPPKFSTPPII